MRDRIEDRNYHAGVYEGIFEVLITLKELLPQI